jgi:hypothetical protein
VYKLLLDEIVLPYEKIDLTDINDRLNKLEQNVINNPVIPDDLNLKRSEMKYNISTSKQNIQELKVYVENLGIHQQIYIKSGMILSMMLTNLNRISKI